MDKNEYSERLQFEHSLINNRITWLLVSQALLFAGYGHVLDKPVSDRPFFFLNTVGVVGLCISVAVLVGVVASFAAKCCTWLDLRKESGYAHEPFWVRTWITALGFVPDFGLPIVFAAAWAALLCRGGP